MVFLHKYILLFVIPLVLLTVPEVSQAGILGASEHVRSDIEKFPKWTKMLSRLKHDAQAPVSDKWQKFISSQQNKTDKLSLLEAVNNYVNGFEYITDQVNWKESDYWETPNQFFSRGGDCEDFAIAKFATLKKLGFKSEDLRVVVIKKYFNVIHSVLSVNIDGMIYILDNEVPFVLTSSEASHYKPIYSINETRWWQHDI